MYKKLSSAMGFFTVLSLLTVQTVFSGVSKIEDLDHKSGKLGSFNALFIAIDSYKDSKIPAVKSATKNAGELAAVLKKNYGFSTQFLMNGKATKSAIERSIKSIGSKPGTVLIYFAGQGGYSQSGDKGFWYPVDAVSGNEDSYVSNEAVQGMVAVMKAGSVLILSDAAYADTYFGSVHKLPGTADDRYYIDLYNKQNRWGFSSGNDFPKNRFSDVITTALAENEQPLMSLQELYEKVKAGISAGAKKPPRCRSLRNANDQGGEPVFVLTPVILKKIEEQKLLDAKKEGFLNAPIEEGGVIALVVNMADALVVLDGNVMGKGGAVKLAVTPGNHVVEVRKEGYEPFKKTVFVKKETQLALNADLKKIVIKPTKGTLTLTVQPAKAEVKFLNSTVPYAPGMSLDGGTYQVEITAPYYDKAIHDVVVKVNENNSYSFTLAPVKVIHHKTLGNFILVNPGTFVMGSPESETVMRNANEKQHTVTLTKPFYLQEHEMTVGEWRWFVKTSNYKAESATTGGANILVDYNWEKDTEYSWNIPGFSQTDKNPVTCVTWNDAQAFIKWINKTEKGTTFRLPSEAEWEYACRAGTKDRFYFGPCLTKTQANFDGNSKWENCPVGESSKGTVDVGKYPPNAWGFFDMHGNVMEWCQDWLGNYPDGEVTDPAGPQSGTTKIIRGGGWTSYAYNSRAAKRFSRSPNESYSDTGFRLVIEP
jgi:formylglycine-generating enzyme required for sulfatase activity